ncbi:MAG: membrane integrity-associated transporter subunit PqiC [Paraburkholderia sp.]|nr:MAG: membrane integrity-associated transporter subunit PqiC [Paraburkholderia sp.]
MKPDRFALIARPAASAAVCAVLVGATLLSGCASPPESRFYTLGAGTDAARPAANEATKPALLIEVPTVQMPTQVARNQLVVQDDATRVTVLEQERWASPPADELRRALSGDLAARLGTFDVFGSPHPENVPVYRIAVNVRRFESWPGSRAVLDTVWSVRSLRTQAVVTCNTVQTETVGPGYDALVAGHRRAIGKLADTIASTVRALASSGSQPVLGADTCAVGAPSTAKGGGTP